ncbi:MAG: hypothetical protein HC908_17925 [Calothrix sp. SM1_7_51]|nr:hypothetical protein [Calothrix sp. SM1_7_51]
MTIPPEYQNLPGFRTIYSEGELRIAIALAEVMIAKGLGSGGGGATTGGATAAKQDAQTTRLDNLVSGVDFINANIDGVESGLDAINNKIPSGLTITSNRLAVKDEIESSTFQILKQWNNDAVTASNTPPADIEFISIFGFNSGISLIEIIPHNITAVGAPVILNFGIWIKRGATKTLLTLVGISAGDNKITVLSGNAFVAAGSIFVDIKEIASVDCQFAVIALGENALVNLNWDIKLNNFLTSNPGFDSEDGNNLSLNFPGQLTPPLGISAYIQSINYLTNEIIFSHSLPKNTDLCLNINATAIPSTSIPHLGISALVLASEIDCEMNMIRARNSVIDFRDLKYRRIRIRSPQSQLFNINGAASSITTTYSIIECTGLPGNQLLRIGAENSTLPLK